MKKNWLRKRIVSAVAITTGFVLATIGIYVFKGDMSPSADTFVGALLKAALIPAVTLVFLIILEALWRLFFQQKKIANEE